MKKDAVRHLSTLALACLLIAACGSLPRAEPSTQPTAASIHHWEARPVLISLYASPGYTDQAFAWSLMPELVVYADGAVLVTRYDYASGAGYRRSVERAQLRIEEVCALLAQVEAFGFFELKANAYTPPQVTDNGTTFISVEAWRANLISAYALDFALADPAELGLDFDGPEVPAALANTYRLLGGYLPQQRLPYQPERVALRIHAIDPEEAAPRWPLDGIALKKLAKQQDQWGNAEAVLAGQQAAAVYALFGTDVLRVYEQDGTAYSIAVRPLLPREVWRQQQAWGQQPEFEQGPTQPFTCGGAEQGAAPAPTAMSPRAPVEPAANGPLATPTNQHALPEHASGPGQRAAR